VTYRTLINDIMQSADEFSWQNKNHGEVVAISNRMNQKGVIVANVKPVRMPLYKGFYTDLMCERLEVCSKYVPPAILEKMQIEEEIEAIFF
jgi:hypothetical protein